MSIFVTIVRHGESTDNIEDLRAGSRNAPLTRFGKRQADLLGEALQNVPFTAIYTSPQKRARATAEAIHNLNSGRTRPRLLLTPELREQDFGAGEGLKWSSEVTKGLSTKARREFRFQSGESLEEVAVRAKHVIRDIIVPWARYARALQRHTAGESGSSQYASASTTKLVPRSPQTGNSDTRADSHRIHIVLVSHGLFIREFLSELALTREKVPTDKNLIKHNKFRNTGWSELEIKLGEGELEASLDDDLDLINSWQVPNCLPPPSAKKGEEAQVALPLVKITDTKQEEEQVPLPLLETIVHIMTDGRHVANLERHHVSNCDSPYDPPQSEVEQDF